MATNVLVALVLVGGLSTASVAAQQTTEPDTVDSQLWVQVVTTLRLSENWRAHLEVWPRWDENWSQLWQVIGRGAVGRRLGSRMTVWGGYAWIAKPPGDGFTYEQRTWEQFNATLPTTAHWTPSLRVRLEQRFQDGWADSSHRLRLMGRGVRPINGKSGWSLVGWNELLITADDTQSGPAQGIDQNRLFAGTLRQFNRKVGLEFGYLWVTSKPPNSPRNHDHNLSVWLNLTP